MVENIRKGIQEIIIRVNEKQRLKLNPDASSLNSGSVEAVEKLNCLQFKSQQLFYNLIRYFLIKRELLDSKFPYEKTIRDALEKIYRCNIPAIYGVDASKKPVSKLREMINDDINKTLNVLEELVKQIRILEIGKASGRAEPVQTQSRSSPRGDILPVQQQSMGGGDKVIAGIPNLMNCPRCGHLNVPIRTTHGVTRLCPVCDKAQVAHITKPHGPVTDEQRNQADWEKEQGRED